MGGGRMVRPPWQIFTHPRPRQVYDIVQTQINSDSDFRLIISDSQISVQNF